jgi:hypothetical protein
VSRLSKFYTLVAVAVVGFFAYSTAFGLEPLVTPPKERATHEQRASGYRGHGFIFVHMGGFRGK